MIDHSQAACKQEKRLPVWALILIDILGTCLALAVFSFFHLILPRVLEEKAIENSDFPDSSAVVYTPTSEPASINVAEQPSSSDTWKFEYLTTDEVIVTESGYSSHDIYISLKSYDEGEGVIPSPYTVADIYVRDIRCLQSYFAGGKYIPTGHGEHILSLMEKSGAILASNGDYYSMQQGSAVLRNGILYRYPIADYDVFILYNDGSMKTIRKKTVKTKAGWDEAFQNAWQVWCFGPSLLDENGVPYTDLRANLFDVVSNRNPRTGLGYFEPGHYCIIVVDGRSDTARGASIEEFASIFESLGCKQAYNLDGGGSSVMAFNGAVITNQSILRKLPDIVMVSEYEGSVAQLESEHGSEGE